VRVVETNREQESIVDRTSDHSGAYFSSAAGGCRPDAVHSVDDAHTRSVYNNGRQLLTDLDKRSDVG